MSIIEEAFSAFISTYTKLIPNEAMNEILNLRGKALDLQRDNDALMDENRKLKDEMDKLKQEIQNLKAIHRKGKAYFIMDETGKEEGPICYNCYMKNGGVFFLEQQNDDAHCPVCKTHYGNLKTP
jgi:predicted RNase H-like nuclease (RuvC/YqgF family)